MGRPTLSDIISMMSKIPFVGKRLVLETAKRSSQRCKCAICGQTDEVRISDIIEQPLGLLSDHGRDRLELQAASDAPEPGSTACALSSPFVCKRCGGRLGVHTFKGDATDGSKERLLHQLLTILQAIPDLVAVDIKLREKIVAAAEEDVLWVD
jgi:hypothetical protein